MSTSTQIDQPTQRTARRALNRSVTVDLDSVQFEVSYHTVGRYTAPRDDEPGQLPDFEIDATTMVCGSCRTHVPFSLLSVYVQNEIRGEIEIDIQEGE